MITIFFNTVSDTVNAQGLQIPVHGWPMDQMPHTVFRRYGQLETLAACTYALNKVKNHLQNRISREEYCSGGKVSISGFLDHDTIN